MSKALCEKIQDLPSNANLNSWIEAQASQYGLRYLLAHADDGVVWGRFEDGKLVTADQVDNPKFKQLPMLRLSSLQQCRIFSELGEVLLWKSGSHLHARIIADSSEYSLKANPIQENQLLWGTHGFQSGGFTLLRDGSQGLKHAVPITEGIRLNDNGKLVKQVCLVVNHYIEYDDDGLARIGISRLIDVKSA